MNHINFVSQLKGMKSKTGKLSDVAAKRKAMPRLQVSLTGVGTFHNLILATLVYPQCNLFQFSKSHTNTLRLTSNNVSAKLPKFRKNVCQNSDQNLGPSK